MAKVTFSTSQNWVVPAGATSITAKVWGAGGGGGGGGGSNPGGDGGGGGFAQADLSVTAGETLRIEVGTGGGGASDTIVNAAAGGGGGLAGIFRGSVTQGNALIIAGSGGGGSGANSAAGTRHGGAGGGTEGADGDPTNSGAGGTQTAGGAAGGSGGNTAGSALTGGVGSDGDGTNRGGGGAGGSINGGDGGDAGSSAADYGGGGGGAGYYGGGGGGWGGTSGGGGGGGGSGYVTGTSTTLTQGTGQNPPNTGDADYVSGKGVGSDGVTNNNNASDGGDAYIVIEYTTAPPPPVDFDPNDIATNPVEIDQPTLDTFAAVAFDPNDIATNPVEIGLPVLSATGTVAFTPNPIATNPVEIEQASLNIASEFGGRGMDPVLVQKLKERRIKVAYFVEALFDSGDLRLWTGIGDSPPILGHVWTGAGLFLGFTTIEESQVVKATGVSISLTGADQSLISLALQENYQGRPANLYIGLFDGNNQLIGDPFRFFAGQIDLIEIDPQPNGQANYTMKVENRMIDLLVVRPSYYTDTDQKTRYPGDTFFKSVSQNTTRKVVWGTGS